MPAANAFLQLAQQSEEAQDGSTNGGRRFRAADEILREAREKHTKYKTFFTNSSFRPSGARVGMSRIQYGDGDFDVSVHELQRFQESAPRPIPLPEMEEPVQITRTLSRTASLAPTLRRAPTQTMEGSSPPAAGAAVPRGTAGLPEGARARRRAEDGAESTGEETDDEGDGENENAHTTPAPAAAVAAAAAAAGPAAASARISGRSFRGALDSILKGTASLTLASLDDHSEGPGPDLRTSRTGAGGPSRGEGLLAVMPSAHSFSGTASQGFRGLSGSPLRRTPGASMTGLPERWDARSTSALRDARQTGDGSSLFDAGDSPGGTAGGTDPVAGFDLLISPPGCGGPSALVGGGGGHGGLHPHSVLRSSSSRSLRAGASATAPQLMLDLSALDAGDGAPAASQPPAARVSLYGGGSGGVGVLSRTGSRKGLLLDGPCAPPPRSENSEGGGAKRSPTVAQVAAGVAPQTPPCPHPTHGAARWCAAAPPAQPRAMAGVDSPQRPSLTAFATINEDLLDAFGASAVATNGAAGGGFTLKGLGGSQAYLSPPTGSPLAAARAGSPFSLGSGGSFTQRRSFEVGPEQTARNAVLSGWSSRRSSRNLFWQQQQQQQQGSGSADAAAAAVTSPTVPQPPPPTQQHPSTQLLSARASRARLTPTGSHSPVQAEASGADGLFAVPSGGSQRDDGGVGMTRGAANVSGPIQAAALRRAGGVVGSSGGSLMPRGQSTNGLP